MLLSEADAQLKAIEVESYNNYKLMANGLITETITHELHSLSKTGIVPDASEHFDFLKDYFVQSGGVRVYNQHVIPIKNSYGNISGKLDQIGSLYSFLETTFIKKGTYDEFIYECIESVISNIRKNLLSTVKKERVQIVCSTKDLTWFVPKGVLLHVFYNLINNSLYDEDLPDADLQQLNTLEAFDYTVNDYFLPVTAGDIFTNSKDEWFVLIGQDCDMARSITRTPKDALAELLPAKVRTQTDFEKWTNDLRSASIYSFRKNLDAGCEVLQVE